MPKHVAIRTGISPQLVEMSAPAAIRPSCQDFEPTARDQPLGGASDRQEGRREEKGNGLGR